MTRRLAAFALLLAVLAACGGSTPAADGPSADYLGGRDTYGTCAACHGKEGTGGVGPAFASVLETWPSCEDHVEWVLLGSNGWKESHGDRYGATDKPVTGGMPSFATLTDEEIRRVALYERVRFGGADEATEAVACGLG